MTMPIFEPIGIFFTQEQFYRTDGRSKVVWTYAVPPWGQQVFTADQLQQAYEAGKAAQVEQEPVAYVHRFEKGTALSWYGESSDHSGRPDWIGCKPLYTAPPAPAVPDVLFDGYAVYQQIEMDKKGRNRTSPENVTDVLDAVVKLIRAASPEPTK